MCELCDIAFKYGTDKCPQIKHHFTEYYNDLFRDRRETVRKVVEIGIGNMAPYFVMGASLYMWREYFPNAQIYGADIDLNLLFQSKRISTCFCDQTNTEDLKHLIAFAGSDIDLFVDDGLHDPQVQISTCRILMPMLSHDTIYAIEDAALVSTDLLVQDYDVEVCTPGRRRQFKDDRLVIVRHRG